MLASKPSSDVALLPTQTRPESARRRAGSVAVRAVWCARAREPMDQRMPGHGIESFTRNGDELGLGDAVEARERSVDHL